MLLKIDVANAVTGLCMVDTIDLIKCEAFFAKARACAPFAIRSY